MYALSIQQIKEEMRNGKVALEKYVITKALIKSPEAYTDSKSQPHVQVSIYLHYCSPELFLKFILFIFSLNSDCAVEPFFFLRSHSE